MPTKKNTEILFGGEQIFTAKYKFQVQFVAKAQGLEHTLFSNGTSRFLRLKFRAIFWSSATSGSEVMGNVCKSMEGNVGH